MRDLAFMAAMAALLPLALMRPFAGVLLWSWISFMNPHRLVWGVAMELPWAMAVFAATVIGCFMAAEPKRIPTHGVALLLVMLLGCFTITSFAAMGDPTAVWAKWEATTKVILGLLLTAALLTERRRVHALVWVMIISIGYYGVRGGIFSIVTGGQYRVWGPDQTMITDNNHLAAAMLVTLPLMHYLRLHSKHRVVRQLLLAAMVLTLLATVASYSRGALLGLMAIAGMMWLRSKRKVISAVVMTACLAGAIAFMPGQWGERMESITTYQQDASASERLVLWGISLDLALQRPLVGSGFTGPYNREVVDTVAPGGPARAVHSIWFELLGEHGFPTFFIWSGLSLTGLLYAIRLSRMTRHRPDLAWAHDLGRMGQVSIMAYLVSGSFLSLSYWDFYWTLLVVIAATHALAKRALAGETLPGGADEAAASATGWRNRAAIPRPAMARDALPRSARA
ncbi:putative O-glycosylation ligase, exosortase A system-associated [Pseudoroseomonas ludipueritiae]|uniref:O-glycosylation ligase, exosortase A system-associated n=1 Tax=Pseudoroseomonas ludipueritiae TaxID=198093 RepID=A0ABR7RBC2_9PROT|nr:putative O-glycosylation ligase, exosortase A system-associated [Pseudoroseomonas ludipueritiae]MBC9179139.1 putative O-glycosylation ligase, exosortase A system-associated [Pseudoroseomonas ludipueritiae]